MSWPVAVRVLAAIGLVAPSRGATAAAEADAVLDWGSGITQKFEFGKPKLQQQAAKDRSRPFANADGGNRTGFNN